MFVVSMFYIYWIQFKNRQPVQPEAVAMIYNISDYINDTFSQPGMYKFVENGKSITKMINHKPLEVRNNILYWGLYGTQIYEIKLYDDNPAIMTVIDNDNIKTDFTTTNNILFIGKNGSYLEKL